MQAVLDTLGYGHIHLVFLVHREFAVDLIQGDIITVSEDTLLQQPGMHGLREELLRQALEYYQTFLDERQDDPSLRQEVADAHYYAGTIIQMINSPTEALPHFERSAALHKALLENNSGVAAIKAAYKG